MIACTTYSVHHALLSCTNTFQEMRPVIPPPPPTSCIELDWLPSQDCSPNSLAKVNISSFPPLFSWAGDGACSKVHSPPVQASLSPPRRRNRPEGVPKSTRETPALSLGSPFFREGSQAPGEEVTPSRSPSPSWEQASCLGCVWFQGLGLLHFLLLSTMAECLACCLFSLSLVGFQILVNEWRFPGTEQIHRV